MPYVTNNGTQINYEVIGNGPPLIMLHPNGHCLNDWHVLGYTEKLKKYFQLILIDSRGFGESDKPHDPIHYQSQLNASDVIAVLDILNISVARCFGYSMGGRNAFSVMRYYPERIQSFIIGGAHPYTMNKLLDSYIKLLHNGLPKLIEIFEKNFGDFPKEVKKNFLKNDLSALLAANSLPTTDFSQALANYTGKVSFVVGDQDPILNYVKQAQKIKVDTEINIISKKNHMQLYFSSGIISNLLISSVTNPG